MSTVMELCILSNKLNACDVSEISRTARSTSHATRLGFLEVFAVDLTSARPNATSVAQQTQHNSHECQDRQQRGQARATCTSNRAGLTLLALFEAGSPPSADFSSFLTCVCIQTRSKRRVKGESYIMTCIDAYSVQHLFFFLEM